VIDREVLRPHLRFPGLDAVLPPNCELLDLSAHDAEQATARCVEHARARVSGRVDVADILGTFIFLAGTDLMRCLEKLG
jgi:hypothetical protein